MKIAFVCVDYQKDFCEPGGRFYEDRPCHKFIGDILVPFFKEKNIKVAEIVSDYRLPRPGGIQSYCVPGEWGAQSLLPSSILLEPKWVKAMKSPEWMRNNQCALPGMPEQNGKAFSCWLEETIGTPNINLQIVVFGLTLDCCVLYTAQQLAFRNYKVSILSEATDVLHIKSVTQYLPPQFDYKRIFFDSTHSMVANELRWDKLRKLL